MSFIFTKCLIEGLYEIQPDVHGDSRGFFIETYKKEDFFSAGSTMDFVQDNMSHSKRGVLRGLHFQKKHPQGKLVSVVEGEVFDVAVDLRKKSPTFGKYYSVVLSSEKHNMFYIPEGFAHGFAVLTESATFCYKCTDVYHPEDEYIIRWNDPTIDIKWPDFDSAPLLSPKDTQAPFFDPTQSYFQDIL